MPDAAKVRARRISRWRSRVTRTCRPKLRGSAASTATAGSRAAAQGYADGGRADRTGARPRDADTGRGSGKAMSSVFTIGRHTIGLQSSDLFRRRSRRQSRRFARARQAADPSCGGSRRQCGEVPEFPRPDDRLRSRLSLAGHPAIASGGVEKERLRSLSGCFAADGMDQGTEAKPATRRGSIISLRPTI